MKLSMQLVLNESSAIYDEEGGLSQERCFHFSQLEDLR